MTCKKTHGPLRLVSYVALAVALLGVMAGASGAAVGDTTRVSVSSSGAQGNHDSWFPDISANRRFVLFTSGATNLVANDTNNTTDAFLRDRQKRTTKRVSVSSSGAQARGYSHASGISSHGRFVAFESVASNVVANDTNGKNDVFVRDRRVKTTRRISVGSSGRQANGTSYDADISADGRFVVFTSGATNLVANDTNGKNDVFVRDRQKRTTKRVSVSSSGDEQANRKSSYPSISPDGRFVAFQSLANNLVTDDTNRFQDVFVRDLQLGTTERASVSSSGDEQADGASYERIAISSDGRFVAFGSGATNLVANDTNPFAGDVFVRDRQRGTTQVVSVSSSGEQTDSNDDSFNPAISSDGRFVAFHSDASFGLGGDWGGVFVRDRWAKTTRLASVSGSGDPANDYSYAPSISADGRLVAFYSYAANLVKGDTNDSQDIFVHAF